MKTSTAALLGACLVIVSLNIAVSNSTNEKQLQTTAEDSLADVEAITIKLNPTMKRKKADVRAVVEHLRSLPELHGSSVAAASRDLLVLIPGPQQSIEELKLILLRQPEVYELEIGEELFRREGDKPYDQLRKEKLAEVLSSTKTKIQQQIRDKLRALLQRKKRKSGAPTPVGGPTGPLGGDKGTGAPVPQGQGAKGSAGPAKQPGGKKGGRRVKKRAVPVPAGDVLPEEL